MYVNNDIEKKLEVKKWTEKSRKYESVDKGDFNARTGIKRG